MPINTFDDLQQYDPLRTIKFLGFPSMSSVPAQLFSLYIHIALESQKLISDRPKTN